MSLRNIAKSHRVSAATVGRILRGQIPTTNTEPRRTA
jgi:hypothetical protein